MEAIESDSDGRLALQGPGCQICFLQLASEVHQGLHLDKRPGVWHEAQDTAKRLVCSECISIASASVWGHEACKGSRLIKASAQDEERQKLAGDYWQMGCCPRVPGALALEAPTVL